MQLREVSCIIAVFEWSSVLFLVLCGIILVFLCCCSVYSGHHTYLISPYELDNNPLLWLSIVSSNKSMCMYL